MHESMHGSGQIFVGLWESGKYLDRNELEERRGKGDRVRRSAFSVLPFPNGTPHLWTGKVTHCGCVV
jgi:hypothetical protein